MPIYNVSTAAQFQNALAAARGGDRIVLAAGDYGSVSIQNKNFAHGVTIQASSTVNRAHFDSIKVLNSSNIVFEGLDMGRGRLPSDSEYANMNGVHNSTNIRFNNVKIHGNLDGSPHNDIVGLSIYDSSNVRVTNSDFNDLGSGVYSLRSSNVQITGNDFHDIRLDGVAVASTTGIVIRDNIFRDFKPVGDDHADAIQFWNTGQTRGSSNATINNNIIWLSEDYPGANQGVQGIWIAAPEAYDFRNFNIINNLVYANDRWNGISVNGGNGVNILNNTLMSRSGDDKVMWIRVEGGSGVAVRNNVTEDRLIRGPSTVRQTSNLDLSDTPGMRNAFPDADDPRSFMDLIIPGVGFQLTPSMRNNPFVRNLLSSQGQLDRMDNDTGSWNDDDMMGDNASLAMDMSALDTIFTDTDNAAYAATDLNALVSASLAKSDMMAPIYEDYPATMANMLPNHVFSADYFVALA